jgi:L-methionine (R)-S-oxide reductase
VNRMSAAGLADRYERIAGQLAELFAKTPDHKMPHFFWTGFYRLVDGVLVVGPYQGPLACQVLERDRGVCWAGVRRAAPVLVPDVHAFPGHIACDSRSQSEVVVPLRDAPGRIVGVLDVDSDKPDAFSETDVLGLERIVGMIYGP